MSQEILSDDLRKPNWSHVNNFWYQYQNWLPILHIIIVAGYLIQKNGKQVLKGKRVSL